MMRYYANGLSTYVELENLGDYVRLIKNQRIKIGFENESQEYDQVVEDKYFKDIKFNLKDYMPSKLDRPMVCGLMCIRDDMFIFDADIDVELLDEPPLGRDLDEVREQAEDIEMMDGFYNQRTRRSRGSNRATRAFVERTID